MTRQSMRRIFAGLTVAALACGDSAWAAGASSAPAAAPPATTPVAAPKLEGPLVAGVCLLSQQDLVARSKVGQAAMARLKTLTQGVQSSLEAEKASLERKGAALQAQRATLPPQQYQAQGMALNQKGEALQARAAERSRQIDATRTKALSRIIQQASPYIADAYAAHACGLLVSREAILGGNMGNDLTAEVLASLDAKGIPMTFDLEPPSK